MSMFKLGAKEILKKSLTQFYGEQVMDWTSKVTCFHPRHGNETVPFSKRPVRPCGPYSHTSSAYRGFSPRT